MYLGSASCHAFRTDGKRDRQTHRHIDRFRGQVVEECLRTCPEHFWRQPAGSSMFQNSRTKTGVTAVLRTWIVTLLFLQLQGRGHFSAIRYIYSSRLARKCIRFSVPGFKNESHEGNECMTKLVGIFSSGAVRNALLERRCWDWHWIYFCE